MHLGTRMGELLRVNASQFDRRSHKTSHNAGLCVRHGRVHLPRVATRPLVQARRRTAPVTFASFWMGREQLSFGKFREFMRTGGHFGTVRNPTPPVWVHAERRMTEQFGLNLVWPIASPSRSDSPARLNQARVVVVA